MKKIHFVFASLCLPLFVQAQALHPADAYDIKSTAEFAAQRKFVRAGAPVRQGVGYLVPVEVMGRKCTVLVNPYAPKSDLEPPLRWKADAPKCPE
jgi:hypothetical protein